MREITIKGEKYPCFPTMGAMLRFKEKTGREVTEVKAHEVSAVCTYLWCTVKSASEREGKPFTMDVQEFLDHVDPATVAAWQAGMEREAESGEKKSPVQ